MGGAPKVRKRCCGHPDCNKGKGHGVDEKNERLFTPCSPQHAKELKEAVSTLNANQRQPTRDQARSIRGARLGGVYLGGFL
jgi:hypothetical protein